jgi:hypothetical protein
MAGKMILEKLSSNPVHTATDEARLIYNNTNKLLYYATDIGWESLATESTSASGSAEIKLEVWNPDSEKPFVHTGNLWNTTPTIGFSPIRDSAVWADFRMRDNWLNSKDIKFKLDYAVTSTHSGTISMNADMWIVIDGEKVDEDNPDISLEEVIDPPSSNERDILALTTIKIDATQIDTTLDCNVVMKLWRDVDGVPSNHSGWLEMVRLIAYQE